MDSMLILMAVASTVDWPWLALNMRSIKEKWSNNESLLSILVRFFKFQ